MEAIESTVVLKSDRHYGRKAPPTPLGEILRLIPVAVQLSIRMRFEGRSRVGWLRPRWLAATSDIRFIDYSGKDETCLHFEAPTLRQAAPELYEQQELFDTGKPDPEDTGFDLLGDVLRDVSADNSDSEFFDRHLLRRLIHFKNGINGVFSEADITSKRYTPESPAVVNQSVITTAEQLSSETPKPQNARVVGVLDMIRASTQAFALKLDDGQELRGVMAGGEITNHRDLLEQRVLILGQAIYRPSGRLLRIDASEMRPATDKDAFFSITPVPTRKRLDIREVIQEQKQRQGLSAIIGKWPGNETDEEIEAALKELS